MLRPPSDPTRTSTGPWSMQAVDSKMRVDNATLARQTCVEPQVGKTDGAASQQPDWSPGAYCRGGDHLECVPSKVVRIQRKSAAAQSLARASEGGSLSGQCKRN